MNPDYECIYRLCKHPPEDHINGNCFAITEPDKDGVEKFCKCDSQYGINLRLYPDLKERQMSMTIKNEDFMTTTVCAECKKDVLLRRDESHCLSCRAVLGIKDKKLKEIPSWFIRQPVSQEDLQKLI